MALKNKLSHPLLKPITSFSWLMYGQSFLAALWILLIPGEAERAIFMGYSLRRLALLVPIIGLVLVMWMFVFLLKRKPNIRDVFLDEHKRSVLSRWLVAGGTFIALVMLGVFTFYHYLLWFPDVGAFFRLLPLMILFFLAGIETILFVPLYLFKRDKEKNNFAGKLLLAPVFWITLGILLAILALIEITGIGKEPVRVSIITLGVPLLEGQIWFTGGALAILLLAMFAWSSIPSGKIKRERRYFDLVVFLLVWLVAFAFWMQFPLPEHNYFAPAVRPPTYEKYPFSDAEQYDYNSLYVLFGALDDFVVSKPLYVSFLAMIHFLVGFDYGRVVLLQTAVLAFLPAVGYLIGKEHHSRLAGGGLAMLLILREANGILASTIANVSNSKLLMSDVPATLVIAIMVLVIIRWCKTKDTKVSQHPFLLGGLTAMLNLMRIQTMAFIPFILVLIIIRYFRQWKQVLLSAGIFLLTVTLLLSPILVRNHEITGVYWLDNPASSSALYRFILEGSNIDLEVEAANTSEAMIERNFSVIFTAMRDNLGEMVTFILENFARNLISTLLIFPVRLGNGIPFEGMLRMASPFFMEVYSQHGLLNTTTLLVNLAIISLGFSALWRRKPLATVMTTLVYLAYNASSSVVRLSGWRFIQPVDWIVLLLFTAGLLGIITAIAQWIFRQSMHLESQPVTQNVSSKTRVWPSVLAGMAFVFCCAFIPLREGLLPDTYPSYEISAICGEIRDAVSSTDKDISAEEVYAFCMADTTRVFKGFGFYPRYFKAGEGYYSRDYDPFFGEKDYARLVFRLVGGRNGKIYIKTQQRDIPFADGDLVYALVYDQPKADAQLVVVGKEEPIVIIADPIIKGKQKLTY